MGIWITFTEPFFHTFFINILIIFQFVIPLWVNYTRTMATDKQERSVVHLELNSEHYYFGSVKALCDNFG